MEQYIPGEHTPSGVPRCHPGQNHELQRVHTQHKDEGGQPKQPPEEVSNSKWVVTHALLEQQHWRFPSF